MNSYYEEIFKGETFLRRSPGTRHDLICERLHTRIAFSLSGNTNARLLPTRSIVQVAPGTFLRPDVALITSATGKLWLAAEVINSHDHRLDTVTKKAVYEDANLPRLWMVDPRYNNVEIYHGTPHGLVLKSILALKEVLEENLLPDFQVSMLELFAP